jgi:tripeptidyl-peptidase-1
VPDAELAALVVARSDPRSDAYGRHVASLDELAAHFSASEAAVRALEAFAAAENASVWPASALRDLWSLEMAAGDAERAFQARLHAFRHTSLPDVRVLRPDGHFSMPEGLEQHVMYIDGLENFPTQMQAEILQRRQDSRLGRGSDPFQVLDAPPLLADTRRMRDVANVVTPAAIRLQYDIPETAIARQEAAQDANKLVIGTFLHEFYRESDLDQFIAKYGDANAGMDWRPTTRGDCIAEPGRQTSEKPSASEGGGGDAAAFATGEASLDVQVAAGIARGGDVEMLCYTSLRDPSRELAADNQEPFLTFLQDVNAMEPPPAVVSISYTDDECSVPVAYARAVNRELMKSALRGVSVIISAGDAGVQGSNLAGFCRSQPSSVTSAPCDRFLAMFPASSPYVTSVGATSIDMELSGGTTSDGKFPERVTSTSDDDALITSGGGFSELFAMPEYQRRAVESYLLFADSSGLTPMFNISGRAYPDIAAVGHAFPVIVNGDMSPTDGTSVSAPLLASMILLLNKQRASRGQPKLGFLNPLLYALNEECPQVFQDITQGETSCGSVGMSCCPRGHIATKGWDATSGVGTIRFEAFANNLDECLGRIKKSQGDVSLGVDAVASTTLEAQLRTSSLLLDSPADLTMTGGVKEAPMTSEERVALQALISVALIAAVGLLGLLVSLRRQLFTPRVSKSSDRYYSCDVRESAREYLLGSSSP